MRCAKLQKLELSVKCELQLEMDSSNNIYKKEETSGFQLTKQLLELSFEKDIQSFTVKLGTNPGDNYLSIIHAVDVTFKGDSESNHYLIKSYPNHPGRRKLLDELKVFEKEYFIYHDLFPRLNKIAVDCGEAENGLKLSLAPFHGGNILGVESKKFEGTPWSKENFIIMTDLRTTNYKMADRTKGLNMEYAGIVLQEMSKLHAFGWAYKVKNGWQLLSSKFPTLIDNVYFKEEVNPQIQQMMGPIYQNTLKVTEKFLGSSHPAHVNLTKIIGGGVMDLIRKFMRPQGENEDEFEEMLRVKPINENTYSKDPWLTGTHGDCWVNNLLFQHDDIEGRTKPVNVAFVDFQMFREACPTVDIAYFFYTSIREPIRSANKDKLLEIYHDAFLMYCNQLKVSPYPGFSLESLKRRFRRSEIYGMLVALPLLSVVLKPCEESIDMDKSEARDAVELYSKLVEGSEKNEKLNDEIIATVLHLYENGVL